MDGILQDVARAARGVVRGRGFSAVVILTVALGIGATTSIFSVVYGVLLAPLPYPDSDRIVIVNEQLETSGENVLLSYANGQDFKSAQTTFDAVAMTRGGALTLDRPDGAQQVSALFVDPEFFAIFDARPAVGRLFGVEENRVPGGHALALLTFDAWHRHFGGDLQIVGSSVSLSGTPFTVIGVLSDDFREPFPGVSGGGNDVIVPAMMIGQIDPRGSRVLTDRRFRTFSAVGRLRPGTSVAVARADLRRVAGRLQEVSPINQGVTADATPFVESTTQGVREPALTLLAGAVFLLFIACFNVANLLLVRAASRTQELAVQLALGAERSRLFRLLSLEGFVLALAGGGLGVLAAWMMLPTLLGMAPSQLPPTADVRLSLPVLSMAVVASLAAGAAFGLLPAFRLSRTDLRGAISGGIRSVGDRRGERVRQGLVFFEIATATTLLSASVVLISSFTELTSADSGFTTQDVLTMQINLPTATYADGTSMASGVEQIVERVAAVPGVEWAHPWGPGRPGLTNSFQTSIPDHLVIEQMGESPLARRHAVAAGALEDLGIELIQGRTIQESDRADSPPVVVVSESMADELWPNEDPIGKRYHSFQPPGEPIPPERHWTVVGVVRDAKHGGRVQGPGTIPTDNDSYFAMAQRPERAWTLLVKTAGPPSLVPIQDAIRRTDPGIAITQVATMKDLFAEEEGTPRFAAQLMGSFGLAALLLAAMGVYGVISFTVAQRTREIGLRAALGAERGTTLNHFLRHGLTMAGGGVTLGSMMAFGGTRGLQALLPEVPSMDAGSVVVAATLLIVVAVLASLVPALRATRIDPVVALKGD